VPFLGTAMAGTITLSTAQNQIGLTLNQGFYQSSGAHTNAQTTTISTVFGDTQRSFFIFNLAELDLNGLIVEDATLRIFNAGLGGATVEFFDVLTSANIVKTNAFNTTGTGIFRDLGEGTLYGGGSVNVAAGYVSFDLLDAASNAMNLTDGYFGIGASLKFAGTAFSSGALGPQRAFLDLQTRSPNPPAPVPDSSATFTLFGLAGAALAVLRRRL
jgi:hypothetical protein